ncbi:MAG: uL22 family ribosomal protein [Candidatus Aenigmatarchaeota archaeon]
MLKYAFNPGGNRNVSVYGRGLRVSTKNSELICGQIRGKSLPKAKALLQRLVDRTDSLKGRYYTNATTEILSLLNSAENNAEVKGLKNDRLIVNASAHQGFSLYRPRRFKLRRQKRKVTHIQVVLQEK